MRKPAFCICENKDADQLRGNREADQRLCFRYIDRTIPLLPKSEISSLWPSSVAVQPGLCRARSETPKTGFLKRVSSGGNVLKLIQTTNMQNCTSQKQVCVTNTPFTHHFYYVKLWFTGVYFFLIFAPKHRLWVLVRTASLRRF